MLCNAHSCIFNVETGRRHSPSSPIHRLAKDMKPLESLDMLLASMLSWYSIGPFLKHVLTDKYQILLKYRKIRLIYPSNAIEISSAQSRTHRSDKKGLRASLRFSVSCLEEGTASPRNIAYAISNLCLASFLSPCRVCVVNSLFTVSIPKRDTSSCHLSL